ncbi:MAG: glycosyltransferase [Gammaproteobacteria bacterium]|nr:glycosyltransferase [Gammaproteobacteria bacterium]
MGGGANSFSLNARFWARKNGYQICDDIADADVAIVMANRGINEKELRRAKHNNCFVVHRIDEFLGGNMAKSKAQKHAMIRQLNEYADVTVFQSDFVRKTALPFLGCDEHVVIRNGTDPLRFRPARQPGTDIGYVAWAPDKNKRLDLVMAEIARRPHERFRMVGPFDCAGDQINADRGTINARGARKWANMPAEFHKMKVLFFPAQYQPCSNTVIEAISCGVPVCYHDSGGTPELVRNCGEPLERFSHLLDNLRHYRDRCLARDDLQFEAIMRRYVALWDPASGSAG